MEEKNIIYHAIGRRKCSVARIYLKEGHGDIKINKRSYKEYLKHYLLFDKILKSIILTNNQNKYDILITVFGGGFNSQAEAISLAISRALCKVNLENRSILKPKGLLTRDSRIIERKKYGRKKARKKFQFSKR
ncbi:MAG: 30S ribosomal protein S9 [Candidatus Bostrichicola ureolyticus]|nr:MAG: 30S ribosomal protein S9 [Candidatus Bostrichicola ureolyticus]